MARENRILALGLVLLASPVVTAQTVTVMHVAPRGVISHIVVSPGSSTKSLPANSNLMPALSFGHRYAGCASSLSTSVTSSSGRVRARILLGARKAQPQSNPLVMNAVGSVLTLASSTPLLALATVTLDVKQSGATAAIGNAQVAVPGYGTLSAKTGTRVTKSFRVGIHPLGFAFTTDTKWSLSGRNASAAASIDIDVRVLSVRAAPYGRSCGPVLYGRPQLGGALDLLLKGYVPNASAIRQVGTRRLSLKIPGTGCFLNTDYLLVLPFSTDAKGEHSTRWQIPRNIQFNVQDIVVQQTPIGVRILTSNGVAISRR